MDVQIVSSLRRTSTSQARLDAATIRRRVSGPSIGRATKNLRGGRDALTYPSMVRPPRLPILAGESPAPREFVRGPMPPGGVSQGLSRFLYEQKWDCPLMPPAPCRESRRGLLDPFLEHLQCADFDFRRGGLGRVIPHLALVERIGACPCGFSRDFLLRDLDQAGDMDDAGTFGAEAFLRSPRRGPPRRR